jgi:hypothetical protein
MIRFLFYLVAIVVVFGAGFVAGCAYTEKNSKTNSYIKSMRSHGDYGDDI